jgi:hypothetical protein
MSVHCRLSETDIPPVGCGEFEVLVLPQNTGSGEVPTPVF